MKNENKEKLIKLLGEILKLQNSNLENFNTMMNYLKNVNELLEQRELEKKLPNTAKSFAQIKNEIEKILGEKDKSILEREKTLEYLNKLDTCDLCKGKIGKIGVIWTEKHAKKLKDFINDFKKVYQEEKEKKEKEEKEKSEKEKNEIKWKDLLDDICEMPKNAMEMSSHAERAAKYIANTDLEGKDNWSKIFQAYKDIYAMVGKVNHKTSEDGKKLLDYLEIK